MKYVCTGATLKCTMGTSSPKLIATPKKVSLTEKDQANVADYVSIKNVPSFGRCRSLGYPPTASATAANHGMLTPMPCVPGTCPKWQVIDKDSLICGEPALLESATLQCMYGGTISIINPGQTLEIKACRVSFSQKSGMQNVAEQEIQEELLQEFNELNKEGLTQQSVLDGIQVALDVAGMVPVAGAIPDLMNAAISAIRGDWVGAGLSIVAAVPGIGDVAGGAKVAYKGAKIAGKVSATSVKTGKTALKTPSSSNTISMDSYRKNAAKGSKESNKVIHLDEVTRQRIKNRIIEKETEFKKVANSNGEVYWTSKTTVMDSIGETGKVQHVTPITGSGSTKHGTNWSGSGSSFGKGTNGRGKGGGSGTNGGKNTNVNNCDCNPEKITEQIERTKRNSEKIEKYMKKGDDNNTLEIIG